MFLQIVQHGVNGGITSLGLLAATGGGALIGLICFLAGLVTAKCEGTIALKQLLLLPIGAFAGLFGSLCDSLLGATMQYSGYCVVRKKVYILILFVILFGVICCLKMISYS